ncbi:MAG TPA: PAS domain S-box protein, partial [Candidatus Binatia bacterium]|nr:PAS domain S-box protein [Candidatus Binatia bacterium]
ILHLEDVVSDAQLVEHALREGGLKFTMKRVETKGSFEAAMAEFAPDVVLCDFRLPSYDGITALEFAKSRDENLPVVMVTGAMGDEAAAEAIMKGAADYVLKQNLSRLFPVVARVLKEASIRKAHAELAMKLRSEVSEMSGSSVYDKDLHILVLEDVASDAELTIRELKKAGFRFTSLRVETEDDFRKALSSFVPDLILLDYKLPTFNGLLALEIAKEKMPEVPCILVSGKAGEDLVVEFMHKGVTDYVLKQHIERLVPVVRRAADESRKEADLRTSQMLLRETRERLNQILENIEEYFFLFDPAKNEVLFLSAAYEKIWGLPVASTYVHPESWLEAIVPEDRPIIAELIRTNMDGAPGQGEIRVKRPDGSVRSVAVKTFPVKVAGSITRIAGIGEDITEEKKAESLRKQADQRLETMLRNAPISILTLDKNGIVTMRKGSGGQRIGVNSDAGVGGSFFEQYKDVPRHVENARRALAGETFTDRLAVRKGFYQVAYAPLQNDEGRPDGMIGVATDITEEAAMEVKLKERERQYALVFENVSDIIFLLSVEDGGTTFRFVSVNKAFTVATGVSKDQVEGKLVEEIIPKPGLEVALEKYREAIRDHKTVLWEEVSAYPQGTKHGIVSVTPLFDQSGRCTMLVGAIQDVTVIRQDEVRLKELDTLKNKFIQVVSHQFRTPLNAVRWNLESMLAGEVGKLTESQKVFVRMTYDATLLSILRLHDLLTALDIEEGRVHVEKEGVDIGSLGAGIILEMKKMCEMKEIECVYKAPQGEAVGVQADPEKLRTAIEKIVANAVLYSMKGGRVDVTVQKNDGRVKMSIVDQGIGIPKAEQTKVFTRFFRASNAAVMLPDASGLGLYIAKYFIEAQGGKIGFESEEGKGSTFWVELPAA